MYGQLSKDGINMTTKYEQLANELRENIRLGTYKEGMTIPSEAVLLRRISFEPTYRATSDCFASKRRLFT